MLETKRNIFLYADTVASSFLCACWYFSLGLYRRTWRKRKTLQPPMGNSDVWQLPLFNSHKNRHCGLMTYIIVLIATVMTGTLTYMHLGSNFCKYWFDATDL